MEVLYNMSAHKGEVGNGRKASLIHMLSANAMKMQNKGSKTRDFSELFIKFKKYDILVERNEGY